MAERGIARLFKHGRSQAVRLPAEFRMPGDKVRVRREGNAIVLEPFEMSVTDWFAEIDKYAQGRFMEEGRDQPPIPPDDPSEMFD